MESMQTEREQKRLWVYNSRGTLARIAARLKVSQSAVHAVLYYNLPSKNCRIEKALADAGAPYMAERLAERLETKRLRA